MNSIERYLQEVATMVKALPVNDIRRVVQAVGEAGERGRQIFILGNGGSAATASHMACDLAKSVTVPGRKPVRAIALTDNTALMTAWANDLSYQEIFAAQLSNLISQGDLVIAISGSGNSPNVLRAVEVARTAGATTVGFTGFPGGRLKETVDICVVAPGSCIEQAEDAHLIIEHAIAVALRELATPPPSPPLPNGTGKSCLP